MTAEQIKKGYLLVAEPSILTDESFNRSVVLITEHNIEGSIGFIINKPLEYSICDLVPDIECSFAVYNGGPVEQDNLYFVHNVPEMIPDSIEISDGMYWGGDFEITKRALNEGKLQRDNIRFFLGYSGWESNQLEHEMQANAWILVENVYKEKLFVKSSNDFWKEQILEIGGEYVLWSNAPSNPSLN